MTSRPQLDLFGKQSRSQAELRVTLFGQDVQSRADQQGPAGPPTWQLFSRLVALVVQSTSSQDRLHRVVAGLGLLSSVRCCSVQSHAATTSGALARVFGHGEHAHWVVVELSDTATLNDIAMIEELLSLSCDLYAQACDAEEVLEKAHTDPLTGLWNRRGFIPLLEQALGRWRRSGEEVAVMAIDVDHFKQINDRYGHDGGDLALEHIAQTLQATCRPTDIIARLGGDELVVLLSGCDAQGAARVAQRCQAELAKKSQGSLPVLSLSIGVSDSSCIETRLDQAPASQLLKAADLALYEVKQNGRGGCRIAA